jgi:hypothetical protein
MEKITEKSKILQMVFTSLLFLSIFFVKPISAETHIIDDYSDLNSGTFSDTRFSDSKVGIQLDINASWGALTWRSPDKTIGAGSAFTTDGKELYVMRGVGDILFWKYTPETDSWTTLKNAPFGAYYGSDIQYLDGYIYAIFGGYQKSFARYSVADNTWQTLTNFPELVYQGASMTTNGTDIYAITSNNTQSIYKYSVLDDSWVPLAGSPSPMRAGSDLEYVDGYIYTPRGANTTTFFRYEIATNEWSTMADLPERMNDDVDITSYNGEIYVARQYNSTYFFKYNIATNTWINLPDAPISSRYAGVQKIANDGILYLFRGNNDYRFWKYDTNTDSFVGPSDAPLTLGVGSDAIYYDNALYVTRGYNSNYLYKYDIPTNTWSSMADAPSSFNDDVRGVEVSGALYFFRGSGTTSFYRYNVAGNTWDTLEVTPASVRYGAALAYPGNGDYIYATRGQATNTFWRYRISTNTWDSTVAALPVGIMAHYGATLVSDDGDNILFTAGLGIKRMFRYSISQNTWTEVAQLPYSPYYGSDTTYNGDGKIIALAGWYKTDMWEYDIATNFWRQLKSFAGLYATDTGSYQGASVVSDLNGNYFVTRGGGRAEMLVYTPGITDYEISGTWTSGTYDLGYVSSWNSISYDGATPFDSNIVLQTRTSVDGVSWSLWENSSGGNIVSPLNRFIQVKALLLPSTDYLRTPVLRGITFDYDTDEVGPENPTNIVGYSQEVGGETLTVGESYKYTNPYFTWDASIDDHTSVKGYYVYFGTKADGNPVVEGSFQTTTSFNVNNQGISLGDNYLRIVTEDVLGNKGDAFTAYTYTYTGVSPVISVPVLNDDLTGTTDGLQVTPDGLKLNSKLGGFWQQERLSPPLGNLGYGTKNVAYVASTNKFYVPRGMNSDFYEYDIDTDTWTQLASAPQTIYYGGGAVSGPDGYIYVMRGSNTTEFYRYNIATNTWDSDIAGPPLTVGYGGSMVFDGYQYIYVLRGNNSDFFWRYDTFSDVWETLSKVDYGAPADALNNNAYVGASLAIDRENQLIYATQGNYLSGFTVYNINTDQWTVVGSVPILPSYGSSLAFDEDNHNLYLTTGNNNPYLYMYDINENEWIEKSPSPQGFYYGGGIYKVGNSLYGFRGGNSNAFFRYDIDKDSWFMPMRGLFGREFENSSIFTMNYGADILKGDGDNFYITRGSYADDFMRWNEKTGELIRMPNLPVGAYNGSSLVYDNVQNVIYATGGQYDGGFFKFDISNSTWSEEKDDRTPVNVIYGSSMVYDGSRYIYLTRGSNNNAFYRFDTQGTPGSKWSTLTNAPSTLSYGAELLYKDGYIYTLRGNNSSLFYRYDISLDNWTTLADNPSVVYNDGFLTDGNDGYFYSARGGNTSEFYRYSLANNSWETLPNFPGQIYAGGAGESNSLNRVYALPGSGTNTYSDALYSYIMQTASSGFVNEGTYESQVHDLVSVYKWSDLSVESTINENTNLVIETSTSGDNVGWSQWALVTKGKEINGTSKYKINSPVNQYIKIRFSLSSGDGVLSPVISGYSINYYQDLDKPTNPDSAGLVSVSSLESGVTISPNVWYNYPAPVFTWPEAGEVLGASDGENGSGVVGYYVYWGTTEDTNPEDDGTLQTENVFIPTGLQDSTIYYLKVSSIDEAGNISEDVWDAFIYKYDSTAPVAPTGLSADPSGYTSTDEFSFSWEEVATVGAPLAEYCYKTGATEGYYSVDQCTTETTVTSVPSYRVGNNVFRVRAKDMAGNYSEYATISYFYVDSEHAPAPPTNLQVAPVSNTSNSFGFTWNPPLPGTFYGSQSNLSYLYSVNALPTEFSTSATSLRYLNPGAYATLPGENIFYIVTKDEAGNVNYTNYAQVSFFANTVAPGIPTDIEIADVSVKANSSWRLAVSWDSPIDEGSGVGGYQIYRSVDGENFYYHSFTSGSSLVDSKLIQVMYYYKVKACDSTNNCGAFSETVSFLPDGRYTQPAEMIVEPIVSNIAPKRATVSWITARSADSRVAYGVEPGVYFEEEVSNSEQVVDHSLTMNNLNPGTKYYYVVRWADEDGNVGVSEEGEFQTSPPPSIEEPIVKRLSLNSALIEFKTKDTSKVRVLYGETSTFGGVVEIFTGTNEGTHNVEIVDIKDGTKYYYKINTFDIDGAEYEGEIHSFETLPRPQILDPKIFQVAGTSSSTLLIEWASNTPTSSFITYYPSATPAKARDEVNVALKDGVHRMILLNLESNTQYSIIISGRDFMGNEANSGVMLFTTASDTRPPQIFDLEVSPEIIGNGQEATAQLVVSFKTDEPATSQVEFGEGTGTTYTQKSQEDNVLSENHIVILSGLTPSKVYHLRALSKDAGGNIGTSIDKVVVTNNASENALDLAIKNLTSIFSFLGR